MSFDSPRHVQRRINLAALMSRAGGPTKTANALGKPTLRGHLSNVAEGNRGLGDKLASDLERCFGLVPGWMDRQHSDAGEPAPKYAVAQPVSYLGDSHDLPYMPWEAIVGHEVPALFRSTLPDDALAPDFPAGTEIVWTTRRRPAPGRVILVKDRHGQAHARQCRQGREPGQWLAAPINPAYITFDSREDGVEVLAVYKGRLEPDD